MLEVRENNLALCKLSGGTARLCTIEGTLAPWWESNRKHSHSRCRCVCLTTITVPLEWQTQHFIQTVSSPSDL